MFAAAAPQGRQADEEHGQAIVKVFTVNVVAHRRFRRTIGRRHDANVERNFLGAADPDHPPGFEHSQELCLQVDRHLGDLVQKQRSALGPLEIAQMLAHGAGERSPLVAEKLGLDEIRRNRTAIDAYKRLSGAGAVRVQKFSGDFLAGARLTDEHHGGHRRRDPAQMLGDFPHFGRFAEHRHGAPARRLPGASRPPAARRRSEGRDRGGPESHGDCVANSTKVTSPLSYRLSWPESPFSSEPLGVILQNCLAPNVSSRTEIL
jgi:hypothetical protein